MTTRGDHTFTVYGARDWSAFANRDDKGATAIAAAAADDPDSAVFCYVDASEGIRGGPPDVIARELEAWVYMPPGSHVTATGTLSVAGRPAVSVTGNVQVGTGEELEFYGINMQEEPSALLLFWSPRSVYNDWRPTFTHVVQSLTYAG